MSLVLNKSRFVVIVVAEIPAVRCGGQPRGPINKARSILINCKVFHFFKKRPHNDSVILSPVRRVKSHAGKEITSTDFRCILYYIARFIL